MVLSPRWTYEQTLIAFRVYLNTNFGRLHKTNPEIIEIASMLDRSPSALVMKCCNFANLDPFHAARGVKGLSNRSHVEEQVWEDYQQDPDEVTVKMEAEWDRITQADPLTENNAGGEPVIPPGPSEVERVVRTRRLQRAFRSAVLVSYQHRCALTGLNIPALLNASHIIPWAKSEGKRADPRNGLCLNALHDRVFDRGLMTFDEDFRAVFSKSVFEDEQLGQIEPLFKDFEGQQLTMPERFGPSSESMAYHRESVFKFV